MCDILFPNNSIYEPSDTTNTLYYTLRCTLLHNISRQALKLLKIKWYPLLFSGQSPCRPGSFHRILIWKEGWTPLNTKPSKLWSVHRTLEIFTFCGDLVTIFKWGFDLKSLGLFPYTILCLFGTYILINLHFILSPRPPSGFPLVKTDSFFTLDSRLSSRIASWYMRHCNSIPNWSEIETCLYKTECFPWFMYEGLCFLCIAQTCTIFLLV